MSDNALISDADRQSQQLASEAAPSDLQKQSPTALAVETPKGAGEVQFDSDVDVEDEFTPRSLSEIIAAAAGDGGSLRMSIHPQINFVVNMFDDEVQEDLSTHTSYEFDGSKFNLIQPLSKLNDRSHRVGVLREPLLHFVEVLGAALGNSERIIVPADTATLIVEGLIQEFLQIAENTLVANFPVDGDGNRFVPLGEEDALPASEYVRVRHLIDVERNAADEFAVAPEVRVNIKFIVHMRIPLLVREGSDKFEKTLKTHFKYLEKCGIKAGMPTAVFAAFNAADLTKTSVMDVFAFLRDSDPELEVLSYRDSVLNGAEFIGADSAEGVDLSDALFNGGDFIVAFSLEKEGE